MHKHWQRDPNTLGKTRYLKRFIHLNVSCLSVSASNTHLHTWKEMKHPHAISVHEDVTQQEKTHTKAHTQLLTRKEPENPWHIRTNKLCVNEQTYGRSKIIWLIFNA